MMKKILCTIILLWLLVPGWAQEFKVASFRLLPNDITAWVNPVRDLNDEACALIKVVGNRDFAFSTPLGIVQRKNEVGEIWLYVPNGTRKITIKHPRWGVLRDYKFPVILESRLTYELVIEEPLLKVEEEYPRVRKVHRPLELTGYADGQIEIPKTCFYKFVHDWMGSRTSRFRGHAGVHEKTWVIRAWAG